MKIRFFFGLIFLFFYFLFFPSLVSRELYIFPEKIISIKGNAGSISSSNNSTNSALVPFKLGKKIGYINSDCEIIYSEDIAYNASLDDTKFINYSSIFNDLILKEANGEFITNIKTSGYPIVKNNRMITINSNRTGIKEFDLMGNELWANKFNNLITCLDFNSEKIILGLLNGDFYFINTEGKIVFSERYKKSRINAVYGCVLSENSEIFSILCGLDPQKLVIYKNKKGKYIKQREILTHENLRKEVDLKLLFDNKYLLFSGNKGLNIVKVKNGIILKPDSMSGIIQTEEFNSEKLIGAVSSEDNLKRLMLFYPGFKEYFSIDFNADNVFLKSGSDDSLFLGLNDSILKFKYLRG